MALLSRPQSARPEKVLIGVAHASREELARLQQELDKRKPRSVGLELREDYETSFSRIGFFGDLYDYLKRSGVSTVLLESPQLWDEYKSAELIKMIHEGSVTLAQIESELGNIVHKLGNRYLAPELAIPLDNKKRRSERALAINREYPNQDALIAFWSELIARRSEYFVRRILETMPEIVIVGLGHAVQVEAQLAGNYRLEKFSGEMPIEIPRTTNDHDLL